MKRASVLMGLMSFTVVLMAQMGGSVKFKEETFDFGNVVEEEGPVTHEFIFTNQSDRPVQVLSVKPSCGCTTPGWTKEPIMPGKTGTIKAQFDPKGRPGYFIKSLAVTTDADAQPINLQIKGTVISKEKVPAHELQAASGSWRLRSNSFNLGKIYRRDEFMTREYEVLNAGSKPVSYLNKADGPSYIRVTVEPPTLQPGQKGMLKISYNGKQKGLYGFQSDNIVLHTSDEQQPRKSFSVYATLEDYFPELSADELAKAPQLRFSNPAIDFGTVKQNQSYTREIQFINSGKSLLEIRAVMGNCTCIKTQAEKTFLKPGESASIKVEFNPQERKGTQTKSVTVYSNDPQNPVQRITLTAVAD